jgi:hypothetical protein
VAFNHSAYFQVDEETFGPGVEMMTRLALDFSFQSIKTAGPHPRG